MRQLVLALAAAGTALAFASPAAALQYYPQPQPQPYAYGYNGYGYGNGYGFNNFGQVRALQTRIDAVEHRIRQLDRRNVIRDHSADRLRREADRIEDRLHRAARGGLNPYEMNDIQVRIARLEQRVQYAMNGRFGGYGYNGNGYGQNGYHDRRDRDDDGNRDRDDDRYGDRDDD